MLTLCNQLGKKNSPIPEQTVSKDKWGGGGFHSRHWADPRPWRPAETAANPKEGINNISLTLLVCRTSGFKPELLRPQPGVLQMSYTYPSTEPLKLAAYFWKHEFCIAVSDIVKSWFIRLQVLKKSRGSPVFFRGNPGNCFLELASY